MTAARTHARVVWALLLREMATRYGRSSGGYVWALAEPVGAIAMLSVAFSFLTRQPSLGDSFIVFFASGYLAFHFYRATGDVVSGAIGANRALLKYPNTNAYDALIARLALQTLTNVAVTTVILVAAIAITRERVAFDIVPIAQACAAATLLGAGVGFCNAVLFQVYPVWQRVWGIINRPLFIISGIFFTPEDLPAVALEALYYNPLTHIISVFRTGLYGTYQPVLADLAIPAGLGAALVATGLLLLRRHVSALGDL